MKITVILCTFNRCQGLAQTLESVVVSRMPESVRWEVLVVDNHSTDQTHEVVEDFRRRYPERIRYLFEPQPGKSYALNSGIREASGDVLAFLDDDVWVTPDWLRNLTGSLDSGEWAGAGGRIILQWPSSLPTWVSIEGPYSRHCFPGFDKGNEPKSLVGPPFGANMAFRKNMFDKYGPFRTDLGPSSADNIPPHSEDTEFGRRLIAGGEQLRYEPAAIVYHPVSEKRIDKNYFLKWRYDLGRANIRIFGTRPGAKWCIAAVPLYLLRGFAKWTACWMFTIEPSRRFFYKVTAWEKFGEIVECRRQTSAANQVKPQSAV